MAVARIGISGWRYPPWRGRFYPEGLRQADELIYAAQRMGSIEINGSFYSLQRPESFVRWRAETPDDGFVFAVKGGRFITHMKRLRDARTPLANFLASGVLALGPKLGPLLWQLPPTLAFDPQQLDTFLRLLPRTTADAAKLAAAHDHRLDDRDWTSTEADRPLLHAMEVRHPSFAAPEAVSLLREHGVALVVADTAGKFPVTDDVTADFVYVRLHGDVELYTSGYGDDALTMWAGRIRSWLAGEVPVTEHTAGWPGQMRPEGRDVYVYFDNDVKAHAPADAMSLAAKLGSPAEQDRHVLGSRST